MSDQRTKNANEVASMLANLMGNMSNESQTDTLSPVIYKAARLMLEAQSYLVSKGLSEADALARVKLNFERVNLSCQHITLEQLTN